MPETYGKRQRHGVKVKKAAAREERRIARNRRRQARAAGEEDLEWLGAPNPSGAEDVASSDRED